MLWPSLGSGAAPSRDRHFSISVTPSVHPSGTSTNEAPHSAEVSAIFRDSPGRVTMQDVAIRNHVTFSAMLTVWDYQRMTELQVPEAVILDCLRAEFAGKRILDIGVGGGRTTSHLLGISEKYTGIDYSSRMIEKCRARYPSQALSVCDVRDLSRFGTASFDFVMFSFNGIDCLSHEDRLKALAQIRTVLAPGGVFVFSSHNHRSPIRSPWNVEHLPFDINPLNNPMHFFRRIAMYPKGIANFYVNKRYEQKDTRYSIHLSESHNYGILVYYIDIKNQVQQLLNYGFKEIKAVGL